MGPFSLYLPAQNAPVLRLGPNRNFGIFVFMNIFYSLFYAFGFLMSLLMWVGPIQGQGTIFKKSTDEGAAVSNSEMAVAAED